MPIYGPPRVCQHSLSFWFRRVLIAAYIGLRAADFESPALMGALVDALSFERLGISPMIRKVESPRSTCFAITLSLA